MSKDGIKTLRDYLESILIAIFLALVIRTFVLSGYKVPTTSMAPTLLPGDFIFSYRVPYGIKVPFTGIKLSVKSPQRGDVVVFTYPEQPRVNYVKRVIGLPGDRVEIKNGQLVVNNIKFSYENVTTEDSAVLNPQFFEIKKEFLGAQSRLVMFQKDKMSKSFGPIVVPPNELFLLGDNRDSSDDSRYWGTVPLDRLEGRVVVIWLSLDWQNKVLGGALPSVRSERLFRAIEHH